MNYEEMSWQDFPIAETGDNTAQEWAESEFAMLGEMDPTDDVDLFFSKTAIACKTLIQDGRDSIRWACEKYEWFMALMVNEHDLELADDELLALLNSLGKYEDPLEAESLAMKKAKQLNLIAKENPEWLPAQIRRHFTSPHSTWLIRNGHICTQDNAKKVAEVLAAGLPIETMNVWRNNRSRIKENHRQMMELEQESPGLCAYLYEHFGILVFARYSKSRLKLLREEKEKGIPTYGWVLVNGQEYDLSHPTWVLMHGQPPKLSFTDEMPPGTWVVEVRHNQTQQDTIQTLIDEHGAGHFVIVKTHGNTEVICWNHRSPSLHQDNWHSSGWSEVIQNMLHTHGVVLLTGCKNGVEGGIGETIAENGHDVYASRGITSSHISWEGDMPQIKHMADGLCHTRHIPGKMQP